MTSLEILLKEFNLRVSNKQDSIATIIEIWSIANGVLDKTQVVYKSSHNHKKIAIYIDFLLEANLLAKTIDKDGRVIFVITEHGKGLLKDCCILQTLQEEYPLEKA